MQPENYERGTRTKTRYGFSWNDYSVSYYWFLEKFLPIEAIVITGFPFCVYAMHYDVRNGTVSSLFSLSFCTTMLFCLAVQYLTDTTELEEYPFLS